MFDSAMFDAVLGLILLYVLLSTVCSALCEYVLRKSRAELLKTSLYGLFAYKPKKSDSEQSTLDFLFNHGLIRQMDAREPAYIAPRMFAAAVIDTLIPDEKDGDPLAVDSLRQQAKLLPPSQARDAILAMLDLTGGEIKEAIGAIETWYSDTMDRVSGIYKRRVQRVLFVVGLLVAAVANVDTVMIVRALSTDPALRQQVVAQAIDRAKAPPPPSSDPKAALDDARASLFSSGLPLGWTTVAGDLRVVPWVAPNGETWECRSIVWQGAIKLFGILITAIAVSFGAPFWFDLLNKVANLRAVGPKPKFREKDE